MEPRAADHGKPAYRVRHIAPLRVVLMLAAAFLSCPVIALSLAADAPAEDGADLVKMLDAPILFAKRFNYVGLHIYDTYYKWHPGGGIYILENPSAPRAEQRIRPVIDPTTPETLGEGIYSEPDLSWDATKFLFCHKPSATGSTSVYEIGIDGKGLRRITDPGSCCCDYKGGYGGYHDLNPAYLPDGRIVFTSTRLNGLVPCANTGVDILHVMNADGSGVHAISVNNVNEFDPCVMPDGRILHGRWEYVDKTALTQQSLWTIMPDGAAEEAVYANNMVHPEAILDARPVPGEPDLLVGTLTPHNSPPRGSVAFINMRAGKNSPDAIFNLEHHDAPTYDGGESCEPWPISRDVVLYSGQPANGKPNAIMMIDRAGRRAVVYSDDAIDCHNPIPIRPTQRPSAPISVADPSRRTGRFYVQDIYNGLDGVKRGEVKKIRVIEETSRASATPGGAFNQTFLVSGVLAFSVKNYLGVVPVEDDGSAYFEVPCGRAVYLQALDAEGTLVRSMRTFVQAAPGVTRSCIGCHEEKYSTPSNLGRSKAINREPSQLEPESWGSGYVDFPGMVQPILDRHCVRCHGGKEGINAALDLSGGWTEYFNIGYENLTSRRETQLTAHLIAGIDCMNGTSYWSAKILPTRAHGSGAAPMARRILSGHDGRIPDLTRTERDLIMAWIDSNGLYHGTWDYTDAGCSVQSWQGTRSALVTEMTAAGCAECHQDASFENDWFNLEKPEMSRILRAPLAPGARGGGLGWCRARKPDPNRQRVRTIIGGVYLHGAMPLEHFAPKPYAPPDRSGDPVVSFASTDDPHYRAMLDIIRDGRREALQKPRSDMPGAKIRPGLPRQLIPPPMPSPLPELSARTDSDAVVRLSWERSARTIGLSAELHRGASPDFKPGDDTLLTATTLFELEDAEAQPGVRHYALILVSGGERSAPIRASVEVPQACPPPAPVGLSATPQRGGVALRWAEQGDSLARYHVYRRTKDSAGFERLTGEPILPLTYADNSAPAGTESAYMARAVNRRGFESGDSETASATPLPEIREPVFAADFAQDASAALISGGRETGAIQGKARIADGALDLRKGGFVTFAKRPAFDVTHRISVECLVRFDAPGEMPVVLGCGQWQVSGWFLQKLGGTWRWHVAGIDCDGGQPAMGEWLHIVGTFDGRTARLYQNGQLVAEKTGTAAPAQFGGPLHVGQYSGGPAGSYQVIGRMRGLKVYERVLTADDAKAAFEAGRRPEL